MSSSFAISWNVIFHDDFYVEFLAMNIVLQDELLAHARLLQEFGPHLGRPTVDTLKGSKHSNMKELRFDCAGGVWRIAFAFDTERAAILLVGGNKGGADQKRFYKKLISSADARLNEHQAAITTRMSSKSGK
jgi:hypothetical protein